MGLNSRGENVLETLIRYGNMYQQDKVQQQNSLFGDLGDAGVEIQHPELPDVPRWSAIERLNIEKSLIGIFLSAHPLDEYEFEVREMSNINAGLLTLFDGWRTPDARKAAQDKADAEQSGNHDENDNEDDKESKDPAAISPKAFLEKYKNQTVHFGGIVTTAEDATSKKGNKYGRYTIEDYSGSYQMVVFGEAYTNNMAFLRPNTYVYITGTIQQRGAGMRFFKEKKDEEAEFEFVVQRVEFLQDVQQNHLSALTFSMPLDGITLENIDELLEQCDSHPGNIQMKIQINDLLHNNSICLSSKTKRLHITTDFYRWTQNQMSDRFTVEAEMK